MEKDNWTLIVVIVLTIIVGLYLYGTYQRHTQLQRIEQERTYSAPACIASYTGGDDSKINQNIIEDCK